MSISLHSVDGREFAINVWNWGVLHAQVEAAALFPADLWEPLRFNAGEPLEPDQVKALADFLETRLLPRLRPGERLFFDGSITDVPDDGRLFRSPDEMWKNYSLRRDVLVGLIDFLRATVGPVSFY